MISHLTPQVKHYFSEFAIFFKSPIFGCFRTGNRGMIIAENRAKCKAFAPKGGKDFMEIMAITEALARSFMPVRDEQGNKGSFGKVLAVCGSDRFRGAALLAAGAALKTGAGLCCLACCRPVADAAAVTLPACTLLPLEMGAEGTLTEAAAPAILARREDVLILGPGLGNTADTAGLVRALVRDWAGALVLDADGLNVLAGDIVLINKESRPAVLTPHPGEAARLLGVSISAVLAEPEAAAKTLSALTGAVVLLKGAVTRIAGPAGQLWYLDAPNSGLAKGGSGDLLSGVIGALLARGLTAEQSAILGTWLHSRAGALAAGELGRDAMLPEDTCGMIAAALAEMSGGNAELAKIDARIEALQRRRRLLENR